MGVSWLRFKIGDLDFMSDEKLTPEVLARREYHVRNSLASFALEGEYPSKEAEALFYKFASGEIETIEELKSKLIYWNMKMRGNGNHNSKDVLIEAIAQVQGF